MKQAAALAAIFAGLFVGARGGSSERIELRYGVPSPVEAELPGYVRGHCGNFTAWTAEYLTDEGIDGDVSRDGVSFTVDQSTPAESRASGKTYLHSGYDVGHLPAAANHKGGIDEMRACHLYSATTPQTPELNRSADAWEGLEQHFRELKRSGAEVWLFTGVAFLPGDAGEIHIKTLGGVVWIPTHCWKAAAIVRGGEVELEGYMLPNTNSPPRWQSCRVSIDEIEAATGGDLFNRLSDDVEKRLESRK